MNSRIGRSLAVFILWLSVLPAAWGTECKANSVYFGNGVWVVSERDAEASKNKLQLALGSYMSPDHIKATEFKVAYNHSVSRLGDILESARQILGNEYPSLLINYLLGGNVGIPADMQVKLNGLLVNEAARRMVDTQLGEDDIAEHVRFYHGDISNSGRKVVVVAHSQGNLFVNRAYERLAQNDRVSLGMIAVASPDSTVEHSVVSSPDHVTFLNDLVILAVQVARQALGLPPALSLNDFAEKRGTVWGHEFIPNYLADESAMRFIGPGTVNSLHALVAPPLNGARCLLPNPGLLPGLLSRSFAGVIATDDKCKPNTVSQIIISSGGGVTGTGCFGGFSLPDASSYIFHQAGNAKSETFNASLSILMGLNTRSNALFLDPIVSPPRRVMKGGFLTTVVNPITIDKFERSVGFLTFISGRRCTAIYSDLSKSTDTIYRPNSYVRFDGSRVSVVAPDGVIASGLVSDMLGTGFAFDETHYDSFVQSPPNQHGMFMRAERVDPVGNIFQLNIYAESETDYSFEANFKISSGNGIRCQAVP